MPTNARDVRGQQFGRLTARCSTRERKYGSIVWECVCDCGNIKYVSLRNLANGLTRSCGCLRIETATKTGKANRKYYD